MIKKFLLLVDRNLVLQVPSLHLQPNMAGTWQKYTMAESAFEPDLLCNEVLAPSETV